MSLLLSLDYYRGWMPVQQDIGKTVAQWLEVDGDRDERIFRRKK